MSLQERAVWEGLQAGVKSVASTISVLRGNADKPGNPRMVRMLQLPTCMFHPNEVRKLIRRLAMGKDLLGRMQADLAAFHGGKMTHAT